MGAERSDTDACNFGQSLIIRIGGNTEQLLDTIASDWRDDPELGKVRADRIDH